MKASLLLQTHNSKFIDILPNPDYNACAMHERASFNTSGLARQLRSGQEMEGESYFVPTPAEMSRSELIDLAIELKRERVALGAIITDRVIDRAFNSSFNNARQTEDLPFPHVSIPTYMRYQLHTALIEELRELENMSDDEKNVDNPLVKVHKRHKEVIDISNAYGLISIHSQETEIMAGISTLTSTFSKTNDLVSSLMEKKLGVKFDFDLQKQILRNSYGLISELASMHQEDFGHEMRRLTIGDDIVIATRFDTNKFDLEEVPKLGYRLKTLPPGKLENLKERFKKPKLIDPTERTRCPAIVSFDGKPSGIKRLWDLYVDLI